MSWKQGGPWGGDDKGDRNPWGNGGRNDSPMPLPPDLDDLLRQGRERFRQVMPGGLGPGKLLPLLLLVFVVLIGSSGFYSVRDGQVGVVQRFGAPVRTAGPGLRWKIPLIERVSVVSTSQVFRLEVSGNSPSTSEASLSFSRTEKTMPNRMVTSDLNLVEVDFTVFWQVGDARKFLFNIRNPEDTLRLAAESVVREVIGRSTIEDVIPVATAETAAPLAEDAAAAPPAATQGSLGRMAIEMRDRLQKLINEYDTGINITDLQIVRAAAPQAVADAFADVQQAQQDASSAINQAQVYANTTRAEAEGQSSRIKAEATAYKAQTIAGARGDADRFLKVLEAYRKGENTTATRLYLETMEQVLKGANKVILDEHSAQNVLPYLPLTGAGRPAPITGLTTGN